MTKLLAIEGTDIRLEIEGCNTDCPCHAEDPDLCMLFVDERRGVTDGPGGIANGWGPGIPAWCPLPEKTDREVPDDVRVFGGILRRMYSVVHHCEGTHGPPPTVIELGCGCILARKKYVVWSADEKKG